MMLLVTEEGLVANGRRLLKTPSGQALQDLFVMAQPAGTAKIESSVYYTDNSESSVSSLLHLQSILLQGPMNLCALQNTSSAPP